MTRTSKEYGAISLFLFFIIIGFYGLSFSGIAVTDDEQLFASAAISLFQNGDLRVPQLSGNERLQGEYNSVGPLHPAIGSLLLRLNLIRNIGSVQLLFILPPLYTALTGLLILRLATLMGYPLPTGVFAVLVFCLGTIAWPYSKTYFREPLAMLLLMVVWLLFENILERKLEYQSRLIGFAVFCLALGGLLLTKIQLIVVVPIFSLIGLWSLVANRKTSLISKKIWVGGLALIIFSSLMVYLFVDSILPMGIKSRISISFLEFAWRRILSTPHSGFWNAIFGALFSIGKGFFWYSPITILAILSFFGFAKWRRREIFLPWLFLIALLLTQALTYDEYWWNITWSTRFLLPVLPLMVVASLPVLDHLLRSDKRIYRLIPFLLFSLGFVIQLSAVLISDITYLIKLYQEYGTVYPGPILWGLGTAPVVGHIKMILEGVNWDLVLWRTFNNIPLLVLMAVIFMISICVVGIFGLWHSFYRKKIQIRPTIALIASCIIVVLLGSILIQIANHDSRYFIDREDFAHTNVWIQQNAKPGDVILVDAYLDPIWYYLWSFGESKIPMYSLPNRDSQVRRELTSLLESPPHRILDQLLGNPYDRIWLVCEMRCSPRIAYQKDAALSSKPQQTIFFFDTHTRSQTEIRLIQMRDSDS